MVFEPPPRLVRALAETRRDGADAWLRELPELLRRAVALRGLTVERVHRPSGRSGLVVLVRRADGSPAVLKLAPASARPGAERAALVRWDGFGAVRLLDAGGASGAGDSGRAGDEGVLLLERLHPEMSVRSLPEAKALLEAAGTLRRLWVEPPAGHAFETVAGRTGRQAEAMRAAAEAEPDVRPLVDAALAVREELLASEPEGRLLHGTFRQSKVLAGERMPWLAVGPDPVVGECAFDLARLVRDRVEDLVAAPTGASTTRRRVRRLAESLELDQERVRGWTLFRAVVSGVRARRVGRPRDAEVLLEFAGWL
ncbi:aminoglycoside phosphotransferase family protein [Streptomyces sp. B3I8]|uniref:aminoglycoside phosphotransferase family protein n=1 Tax=Streptomyces sp. B3I8 TaxID=3042303 RepID=UPI0027891B34|nr:aminoglycoside phosphotransferase family protein [Streptomyces sp. B3I8]MDQ0789542.1 streptomycin 6-kinase [Streptomyces sp. B3I8]